MSTITTTPQAATSTTGTQKIFTSRDLAYALKQAEKNGYRILNQGMASVVAQSAVTVHAFKPVPAGKTITTPNGSTVLGYQTLAQTRQVEVDTRSQAQKDLGSKEGMLRYTRVLYAQVEVTEQAQAEFALGTALGKDTYLVEVLSYSPVYPGHEGVVMSSQGVKRFSYKFRARISNYTPERQPDVLLLTPAESEAFATGRRAGLLHHVQQAQMASGLLTQEELNKAADRDKNGKPQPSDEEVNQSTTENTDNEEQVDEETGEVTTKIKRTGFGAGA